MAAQSFVTILVFALVLAFLQIVEAFPDRHNDASASSIQAYHPSGWIPHGQKLAPQLSHQITNGNSVLGTSRAPRLPHYLGDGRPWEKSGRADYGFQYPHTGVTRYYNFTISELEIAPDGVTRSCMVVNGGYPGPTIEANWGDTIEVEVHNALPTEGTAMHWHGLLQHETPYYDGVPGTEQCPIAPGTTFTYRFKADLYGSSWYHSHYSAQYTGGIYGAIVIYGPSDSAEYDEDLGPILVNDWYHEDYYTLVEQVMAPINVSIGPPISNNALINGKMNYPCANSTATRCVPNAGLSKFYVQSGKSYRLRLINAGAEGLMKFSIDGAELTVIANDFVPLEPYTTNVVTLGVAQRTDVIFKATGSPTDAVWMRSVISSSRLPTSCSLNDGVSPEALAVIYYEHADDTSIPTTTSSVSAAQIDDCLNDPLSYTKPFYPLKPTEPDVNQKIRIDFKSNGTHFLFYVNNSTFRVDYNDPSLLRANTGNTTFPAEYNLYNFGSEARSVRVHLENYALTSAHPMHLHGHNMWVLALGNGEWDGTVTNPENPQRRDVQLLPNAIKSPASTPNNTVIIPGYLVLQFDLDNPGIWPLHCHIAWHVSAGLYTGFVERPEDIAKLRIPPSLAQTCRSWTAFTNKEVIDEIDSGL